ncbi:MAG: glucose-6-phosphate isomerase [Bacteroidia bacterium]|nr:glucose-6-phosphate isomerase [Bacteroidia bacterium]
MENLQINLERTLNFVDQAAIFGFKDEIIRHIQSLDNMTGNGNDFLGWNTLPASISETEIQEIEESANLVKRIADISVTVGIGGSYLGAKAVIEALSDSFYCLYDSRKNPVSLFAGQNLSEDYLYELLRILDSYSYGITVISKSGTTTEPAVAFRLLKQHCENNFGKEDAKNRIIAITDKSKGALRGMADKEGYKTFIIPDDVGGRYSVLTPVGLLPIAIAGFDIRKLISGAKDMQKQCSTDVPFEENPAAIYAAVRNALYRTGKKVEILVNYHPKLHYFTEWWKQLYGESEGKQGKGLFPAGADFTSDLHSMGQYIQEGQRILFETVLSIKEPLHKLTIPKDNDDLDKMNYLAGRRIDEVNKMAELGTIMAHVDGGVPNIHIEIPKLDEYYIGQLIYFFEKACAISGYILDVNPFDQPGVEAYKKNMFRLLGKH